MYNAQSVWRCIISNTQTISRFLLGRHKAALDTYAEALTLNPHDWVCGQGMDIALYPGTVRRGVKPGGAPSPHLAVPGYKDECGSCL